MARVILPTSTRHRGNPTRSAECQCWLLGLTGHGAMSGKLHLRNPRKLRAPEQRSIVQVRHDFRVSLVRTRPSPPENFETFDPVLLLSSYTLTQLHCLLPGRRKNHKIKLYPVPRNTQSAAIPTALIADQDPCIRSSHKAYADIHVANAMKVKGAPAPFRSPGSLRRGWRFRHRIPQHFAAAVLAGAEPREDEQEIGQPVEIAQR